MLATKKEVEIFKFFPRGKYSIFGANSLDLHDVKNLLD